MFILNVFNFSEPYEINELLVKLHTEDPGVDEWLITENCYTHQGDYKGPHKLRNIMANDPRFKKFLHKVVVFDMYFGPTVKAPAEDKIMHEAQREVSREYVLSKYPIDDTWLIVSDLDEIMDFTNPNTMDMVFETLKNCGSPSVHPNHFCLAYDYDNATFGATWPYSTITKLIHIINGGITFEKSRHTKLTVGYNIYPKYTGFHYYCCYQPRFIWRKHCTYLHRHFKKEKFNEALYYNVGGTRVELDETNSPIYVRENIGWLKTHSVPEDYEENRRKRDAGDRYIPDIIAHDEEVQS